MYRRSNIPYYSSQVKIVLISKYFKHWNIEYLTRKVFKSLPVFTLKIASIWYLHLHLSWQTSVTADKKKFMLNVISDSLVYQNKVFAGITFTSIQVILFIEKSIQKLAHCNSVANIKLHYVIQTLEKKTNNICTHLIISIFYE